MTTWTKHNSSDFSWDDVSQANNVTWSGISASETEWTDDIEIVAWGDYHNAYFPMRYFANYWPKLYWPKTSGGWVISAGNDTSWSVESDFNTSWNNIADEVTSWTNLLASDKNWSNVSDNTTQWSIPSGKSASWTNIQNNETVWSAT